METRFKALMEVLKAPLRKDGGIKIDNSILMVYPPHQELDFREYLVDKFLPELTAKSIPHRSLDLTGFMFQGMTLETVRNLQEDEFDDYRWMKQGLSRHIERSLVRTLSDLAIETPGGAVLAYATVSLYPLIRLGEILKDLRELDARIVLAVPGVERGGKVHFMNQPEGGNYLAVKIV